MGQESGYHLARSSARSQEAAVQRSAGAVVSSEAPPGKDVLPSSQDTLRWQAAGPWRLLGREPPLLAGSWLEAPLSSLPCGPLHLLKSQTEPARVLVRQRSVFYDLILEETYHQLLPESLHEKQTPGSSPHQREQVAQWSAYQEAGLMRAILNGFPQQHISWGLGGGRWASCIWEGSFL